VLSRLSSLTASNVFTLLRLLPMGDRNKDVEILPYVIRSRCWTALGKQRVRFTSGDRAFLAALLPRLPTHVLRRLLVRPDTVLR
jgi:hypothetical protein